MNRKVRKGLMISRGSAFLLLVTLLTPHSFAQVPAPTPAANIDTDKVCKDARKQDQQNKNNPKYAQSDINTMCASIRAAEMGAKNTKTQANLKIPVVAICTTATIACYSAWGAAVGQALSIGCGVGALGTNVAAGIQDNNMAKDLGQESAGFDYVGTATGAASLAMGAISGAGAGASGAGAGAGNAVKNCGTITLATVTEAATMAMKYDTANKMKDSASELKKGLKTLAGMGGAVDTKPFTMGDDKDADFKDDDLEKDPLADFPPDAKEKIEELTGMKLADIANYDGNPHDLMQDLMSKMGVPPDMMGEAMAQIEKAEGANASLVASIGKESNDSVGAGGMGSSSNGVFGSRGLASTSATTSSTAFRDPASMTAEELEKDRFHDIFLRITQRYNKKKMKDLAELPWSAKSNLFANPKNKLTGKTGSPQKLRFN